MSDAARSAPRPPRAALLALVLPLLLLAGCSASKAVLPPPLTVTVTPADTTIVPGQTVQLTATVSDAQDSVVTWSSGVPSVAVVSRSGLVTGVSGGSVVITASVTGGSGRCLITVLDTTTVSAALVRSGSLGAGFGDGP